MVSLLKMYGVKGHGFIAENVRHLHLYILTSNH